MKPLRLCLAASLTALGLILAVSWTPAVGASTNYPGQVFEFTHSRLVLVDIPKDKNYRKIGPMIIDKKGGPHESAKYQQFPLTETGAFILRLVLQSVDPELIKAIYMAEYNVSEDTAISDINTFLKFLLTDQGDQKALLKKVNRPPNRKPDDPKVLPPSQFGRPLPIDLEVGLNQMGGGGIKFPPR